MPYGKTKETHYRNLGGINTKVSPYQNDVTEFRDLSNVDFRTPSSLTQRDGTTQIIGSTLPGQVRFIGELFGALAIGSSQTQNISMIITMAGANAYFLTGNSPVLYQTGLVNNTVPYTSRSYGPWIFYANGTDFKKFNGGTYNQSSITGAFTFAPNAETLHIAFDEAEFCLPPGPDITSITAVASGTSIAEGTFSYRLSWINRRGFIGPPGAAATIILANFAGNVLLGSTVSGGTMLGWTVPSGYAIGLTQRVSYYGIEAPGYANVVVWRNNGSSSDYFFRSYDLVSHIFSDGGGAIDIATNQASFAVLGATPISTALSFTLSPKYLEVFNNSMFMGGFTQAPNVLAFSDLGEPESVQPESNFNIGSGLGDNITSLIFYNGRLVVGKENSLFSVTGDNVLNYAVSQITDEYGILNNAAVVYNDILLFLDKKGICEFNGANINIISYPVEDIFLSMNLTAAKNTAVILHSKRLNQIWIGIPCNGASENNCTVVYDYLLRKWTKYEGFNPSAFLRTDVGYDTETELIGDYNGLLYEMGSSYLSDNGSAFTVLIKSRWDSTDKMSTTMQYRQLYIDVTRTASAGTLEIKMLPNYQDGASLVTTMNRNAYQSRIDFGLPATSMSVQIKKHDTSEKLVLHGFVLSSRFQRSTGVFSQG